MLTIHHSLYWCTVGGEGPGKPWFFAETVFYRTCWYDKTSSINESATGDVKENPNCSRRNSQDPQINHAGPKKSTERCSRD